MKTRIEIKKAHKKIWVAIDELLALEDCGFGCDEVSRALEILNKLEDKIAMELQPDTICQLPDSLLDCRRLLTAN